MERGGGQGRGMKIHLTINVAYKFCVQLLVIKLNKDYINIYSRAEKATNEEKTKRKDL